MLKKSYIAECQLRKGRGVLRDLRHREVEAADRKAFWGAVKASYARRKDTAFWAAVVFFASGIVLIPSTGTTLGFLITIIVTSLWTAVHTVRRL